MDYSLHTKLDFKPFSLGTLYNLQQCIHFLCGYKKFCFVQMNLTHASDVALQKIKSSFLITILKSPLTVI